MPVALVTGASRGLGLALSTALARRGWSLIIDARGPTALATAAEALAGAGAATVVAIEGDVADEVHRARLAAEAASVLGGLDLLVNNASLLGPSPQPDLASYPLDELARVYAVNTLAPLALIQLLLPALRRAGGRIIDVTSDAAVEAYEGWGGYGSSKAALDQLTAVLAAEQPGLRVYSFDPGDLRTELHQQAFPGEDISDRPEPETAIPAMLRLVTGDLLSGRYRAADLGTRNSPELTAEVPA
jgi:NAD(P)-dependent dehydrogenase (short-subunit alcohol dehydrogenase family)